LAQVVAHLLLEAFDLFHNESNCGVVASGGSENRGEGDCSPLSLDFRKKILQTTKRGAKK